MPVFLDRLGIGLLLRLVFGRRAQKIFVIEGVTPCARLLASWLRALGLLPWEELDFDFVDEVVMPDGRRAIDEIYYRATDFLLTCIEEEVGYGQTVRRLVRESSHEAYLRAYLAKRILSELHLPLRSVLVAAWVCRKQLPGFSGEAVLYLDRSWLLPALGAYANSWKIRLRSMGGWGFFWQELTRLFRASIRRLLHRMNRLFLRSLPRCVGVPPRIAVEVHFSGVQSKGIYHTEFFWYQTSGFPDGTVFAYFAHPENQPTPSRCRFLQEEGIGWIDRATFRRLMDLPVRGIRRSKGTPREAASSLTAALRRYSRDFYRDYDQWHSFLKVTGTRIHVSTSDVFSHSETLHAALRDLGGVSVSIQRSIEREPYLFRRTVTDVHFSFSRANGRRERLCGSSIRQFITCGYPWEDVFPSARRKSREMVSLLRFKGVTFTLCFFDEGEGIHPKKLGGRRQVQMDYAFLCDRLAADKTLGLILKPKWPGTLPQRLGPVWPRVQNFMDSGRCILLKGSSLDEQYLPCAGASGVDLAINLLGGATAGLESYLAGTRTLLIRHRVHLGEFGRLPKGSVVFDCWEDLWQAVERFRADPADPQIGNWEPIMDEFVSLRDDRAAERIHRYVFWLYEALAQGKSREEAMAHAGKLYTAQWGENLIEEIVPSTSPWPSQKEEEFSEEVFKAAPTSS